MKTLNNKIRQKLDEVYSVKPNDLGTPVINELYHGTTKFFKTMPFIFIIPSSFLGALILYVLFGSLVIRLVSLLQYGF